MTKKSFLIKTVLISMLTAVTFTGFTFCSNDDDIAYEPVSPAPTRQHVADINQRVINFEGVDNGRDMGGLVMQDGRTVCFDKLVRSGKLAKATDAVVAILQDRYHLSDVFDFRFDLEISEASDRVISGVTYTQVSTMPQKLIEAQEAFGAGSGQLSTPGVVDVLLKYAFDPQVQEMVKQLYTASSCVACWLQKAACCGTALRAKTAADGVRHSSWLPSVPAGRSSSRTSTCLT